jgi:ABC-type lipoprotein export system ATPase subunit
MIKIKKLNKSFYDSKIKVDIFKNLDLEIKEHEFISIV